MQKRILIGVAAIAAIGVMVYLSKKSSDTTLAASSSLVGAGSGLAAASDWVSAVSPIPSTPSTTTVPAPAPAPAAAPSGPSWGLGGGATAVADASPVLDVNMGSAGTFANDVPWYGGNLELQAAWKRDRGLA